MKTSKISTPALLDEEQALNLYLEALFRSPPEQTAEPETTVAEPEQPVADVQVQERGEDAETETLSCVILNLRGGRIAIRIDDVDGFSQWSGQATRLPNLPTSCCGIVAYRGGKAFVVDAGARLFKSDSKAPSKLLDMTRLAIIGKGRMALVCDQSADVINVSRNDVAWSQDNRSAPWIEGIIKKSLCMLVNCEALIELFLGKSWPAGLRSPTPVASIP